MIPSDARSRRRRPLEGHPLREGDSRSEELSLCWSRAGVLDSNAATTTKKRVVAGD